MLLYETLRTLHFGVHERPLVLAHDPYSCQDSALNLTHLLSGQDLSVVNNCDLFELIFRVVHLRVTAVGSSPLGKARYSRRMGDLTRLAGMLGGAWGRSIALVGSLGWQDLIPDLSLGEL